MAGEVYFAPHKSRGVFKTYWSRQVGYTLRMDLALGMYTVVDNIFSCLRARYFLPESITADF